jgi:hypothetical protein
MNVLASKIKLEKEEKPQKGADISLVGKIGKKLVDNLFSRENSEAKLLKKTKEMEAYKAELEGYLSLIK